MVTLPYTQSTFLPIQQPTHLSTSPVPYLPVCLPINIPTYLPTYINTYLPTYIPTYQYIHNFIRIVPIVPHPTYHWSSFRSELKSVPVRFGTLWSPFRSVSVPIEVRFGIFVGPIWSVPVRFDKSWHRSNTISPSCFAPTILIFFCHAYLVNYCVRACIYIFCIVKECRLTDICPANRQLKHYETNI